MNHLLPAQILELHESPLRSLSFEAATLFLDISGFTPLTEALMTQGKDGAESLADIVNRIFRPVITAVYAEGGYVSGFAGDAFTAIFPATGAQERGSVCGRAYRAATRIRAHFRDEIALTPRGDFPLAVKLGLGLGELECGVAGMGTGKAYFYRGPAVDACSKAEHFCAKGDIVVDAQTARAIGAQGSTLDGGFLKLERDDRAFAGGDPQRATFPTYDIRRASAFYPRSVLEGSTAGEFRRLASLFLSFRDLASGQLDALVGDMLQEVELREGYFNRLDFGDKGGNALMFFGAPTAHENDLARALQCALVLRDKYGRLLRGGVTLGTMYFGRVGIPERCEVTALGNAVNLAARLMMKSEWGQILSSEAETREPGFVFGHIGAFLYKGFESPVSTYGLVRPKEGGEGFFDDRMLGRDGVEQTLAEWAVPLLAGQGQRVALLIGEAGIGKSRLAFALREAIGPKVQWLTCETDSILRLAFNPFRSMLRRYFDQSGDADTKRNRETFESGMQALEAAAIPARLRSELSRTRSFLGALLGLTWPDSLYERLTDPKLRYENTLTAITTFLRSLSHVSPLVLEIEDAHWLDDSSREVLSRMTREGDWAAFLLLVTSRYADDGSKPELALDEAWPDLTIELDRLNSEALRDLAHDQLGGAVQEPLCQFLEERSQGVPFFARQILSYLQETGVLELNDQGWRLLGEGMAIPDSLSGMLIGRLDRLSGRVKETVQMASVLGREFDVHLLSQMQHSGVMEEVRRAEHEQIWSALTEIRYIFKHALLRDAAYDMQLRARLRELHRLAIDAYESLHASELGPYIEELAYHADRCGHVDKQRLYFRQAGDAARDNFRNASALEYYGRLLALVDDPRERADLHMCRGEVSQTLGQWENAEAEYGAALAISEGFDGGTSAEGRAVSRCAFSLGRLCRVRGDHDRAITWLGRACENSSSDTGNGLAAGALLELGLVWLQKGDYAKALVNLEAGLTTANRGGDSPSIAMALHALGNIALEKGDLSTARSRYEDVLRIRREIGDKRGIASVLNSLGIVWAEQGDLASAQASLEEGLAIRGEIGDKRGMADSLNNLGIMSLDRGDLSNARALQEESLRYRREMGDKRGMSATLDSLGQVIKEQGELELAKAIFEESLALRRSMGEKRGIALSLENLGKAAFELGDYALARASHGECLALSRELEDKRTLSHALCNLSLVEMEESEYATALSFLAESLQLAVETGEEPQILLSMIGLAALAAKKTNARRATIFASAASARLRVLEGRLESSALHLHEVTISFARATLGEVEFNKLRTQCEAMSAEEAVRYALEDSNKAE